MPTPVGARHVARAAVIALAGLAAIAAAPAQGPTLVALSHVEPGAWTLRAIGDAAPPERLCMTDATALLQLRHARGEGCTRFTIADGPRAATVHYTCPGSGHGRTTVTVTSPRVLRIETQGIAANAPFDTVYEARHVGTC